MLFLEKVRSVYVWITEYTEWQRPLPGAHSITMEKSAQAGEGGGTRPPPFTISTITYQVLMYAPAEMADTLPLFLLYPYMYSVACTVQNHSFSYLQPACKVSKVPVYNLSLIYFWHLLNGKSKPHFVCEQLTRNCHRLLFSRYTEKYHQTPSHYFGNVPVWIVVFDCGNEKPPPLKIFSLYWSLIFLCIVHGFLSTR